MRRIKMFFPFMIVSIFAVFHILVRSGQISFAMITPLLVLLSLGGYIYGFYVALLLLAFGWIAILPAAHFVYNVDWMTGMLTLIFYTMNLVGCCLYKLSSRKSIACQERSFAAKDNDFKNLSDTLDALEVKERGIREDELNVIRLFELTEKMSGSLRMDDIIHATEVFLKDNFLFRSCEIAILKESERQLSVDRIHYIDNLRSQTVENRRSTNYNLIIELLQKELSEIFFSRQADPDIFNRLSLSDDIKTFAALPLLSENHLVGIILFEDLPYIVLDKVMIVAAQFALEIKKVLLYGQVEALAITDGLTGLYVRRYFLERLEEELTRSRRHTLNFAFLMMDIDNFKKYNDTYGHLVGDTILKEMGRLIKESVREIDLVSRYGGEEFSVILPETDRAGALIAAERIRKHIESNAITAYDEHLRVTISVGVARYPDDAASAKDLIDCSDEALYKAKNSGKNRVCEYGKASEK